MHARARARAHEGEGERARERERERKKERKKEGERRRGRLRCVATTWGTVLNRALCTRTWVRRVHTSQLSSVPQLPSAMHSALHSDATSALNFAPSTQSACRRVTEHAEDTA